MLLSAPQAPELPQASDQVTPALFGSLTTVALSGLDVLVTSEVGADRETEITAIVMLA